MDREKEKQLDKLAETDPFGYGIGESDKWKPICQSKPDQCAEEIAKHKCDLQYENTDTGKWIDCRQGILKRFPNK